MISRRQFLLSGLFASLPARRPSLPQPKFDVGNLVYFEDLEPSTPFYCYGQIEGLVFNPSHWTDRNVGWVYIVRAIKSNDPYASVEEVEEGQLVKLC